MTIDPGTGRLRFVLPTGEVLGERHPGAPLPALDEIATHVGRAIDEHPGASGRELTRGGGLLATALDTRRALGWAVLTVDDRWYPAGALMGAQGRPHQTLEHRREVA